jgi:pimeloyl-ACP methyl ester carboxylesterase
MTNMVKPTIFYFHGSPSTRLEWYLFRTEALAKKLKLRLIVPDRPGLGRSDFQPGRRIGDWPADVIALADHLPLSRFAVVGYSGGDPYAAACALKIPERLTHVGIVSGTGPFDLYFDRYFFASPPTAVSGMGPRWHDARSSARLSLPASKYE